MTIWCSKDVGRLSLCEQSGCQSVSLVEILVLVNGQIQKGMTLVGLFKCKGETSLLLDLCLEGESTPLIGGEETIIQVPKVAVLGN